MTLPMPNTKTIIPTDHMINSTFNLLEITAQSSDTISSIRKLLLRQLGTSKHNQFRMEEDETSLHTKHDPSIPRKNSQQSLKFNRIMTKFIKNDNISTIILSNHISLQQCMMQALGYYFYTLKLYFTSKLI